MAKKSLKEQVKAIVDLDAEQLPAPEIDELEQEVTPTKTKKKAKKIKKNANEALNQDIFVEPPASKNIRFKEVSEAQFKKLFKDEIKETADWLWREDKEKDFPDKATCKKAALRFVVENHPEYTIID